jgi:hypothetical protein
MIPTPSEAKIASKVPVNLASRSRIKNRNRVMWSPRSISRLRAAWLVQAAVGCSVTPRICTLRVRISITNSTYNLRRLIVSR